MRKVILKPAKRPTTKPGKPFLAGQILIAPQHVISTPFASLRVGSESVCASGTKIARVARNTEGMCEEDTRDFPMTAGNEFVQYVLELLEPLGGVSAKAMFGGFGMYCRGMMVALIADETLYLKVDNVNRPDFEAQKLEPFRYQKKDTVIAMSYYQAPPEAMEESDLLCEWVEGSYQAAVRGKKKATKGKKRKKS